MPAMGASSLRGRALALKTEEPSSHAPFESMELDASGLLSTFVISLVAAFAGGLAARTVKLPPLLGYLIAGIVIGPFMPGFVSNQAVVSDLADVGVALLLFNIGLHFSIKDLVAVQKIALAGASVQILITSAFGFLVAWQFFGCPVTSATMIGLSFAIASTAVSTRLLEERHQITSYAGRIALGWLVVQDLAVVIALVVFPAIVKSKDVSLEHFGMVMGQTLLQIAGFAVVIFFGVRKLIPRMLSYVARVGSRELFTLAVIVIALGFAYGSSMLFGVSLALGAFFAGVVIGESDLNHHAAAEALSMQQVFTILFFVSVGMLFDPQSIVRIPLEILISWIVVVIGMGAVTFFLLLFMRVPSETASLVGGSFGQIGEFSFVLSQLGFNWGILNSNGRDLILAVAIVSIILNPLVMFVFPRLGRWFGETEFFRRWRKDGELHLPDGQQPFSGHVIVVGHGRVGGIVSENLKTHGIPYITIESDRRIMESLRQDNEPVIFGDATREAVLAAAHPETARLLIATIPAASQVRRIVMHARRLNPSIEISVRVHADSEARHMVHLGVGLAVMGEREIAIGMTAYALQFFDIEPQAILDTLSQMRQQPSAV